jgi:lipopolysaccharide/colanic/teichoic acid biosynthesis glycosyltransferase
VPLTLATAGEKRLKKRVVCLMYPAVKVGIDRCFALVVIALLTPFLITVAILIKITSKGPVFFHQERVGLHQKPFDLLKFRSMTHETHEIKRYTSKGDGVTRLGYYLRKYKIDELPQLFNVLKGDMSFVGPRPNIPDHIQHMNEHQKKRYLVRPGMTGHAQVSGNIYIEWEKRYEFDVEYVEKMSFWNDVRIILRTFQLVWIGEKSYVDNPFVLR